MQSVSARAAASARRCDCERKKSEMRSHFAPFTVRHSPFLQSETVNPLIRWRSLIALQAVSVRFTAILRQSDNLFSFFVQRYIVPARSAVPFCSRAQAMVAGTKASIVGCCKLTASDVNFCLARRRRRSIELVTPIMRSLVSLCQLDNSERETLYEICFHT